jgi:hypothetical protein
MWLNILQSNGYDTVTYSPIATQRLCKHIPAEANALNVMATVKQRISKHVSLTKEAMFSAWSVHSKWL